MSWEPETTGDFWREKKKLGQLKRASNREQAPILMTEAGIPFESKNGGAHLIVRDGELVINFWPGTGLWVVQGHPMHHRGVFKLIRYVKKQEKKP